MTDLDLKFGFYDYSFTRPLMAGDVNIPGVRPSFSTAPIVVEIFERMIRGREFDVAELGMTYFLRTLEAAGDQEPPFLALPVFLNRQFRHSAVYINTWSGIRTPQDLRGKTIGELALYGHDAGVVPRAILAEDYGVSFEGCRWVIGGLDFSMPKLDFVTQPHPEGVEVRYAGDGQELGAMLDAGEIDALISADVPRCVLEGSPNVARLFPDHVAVERDYYRRTGIFPIMHTVAVRRDLATEHPQAVREVFDAFVSAKDMVLEQRRVARTFNHMGFEEPWLGALWDENQALFGDDRWPYGIRKNRTAIDAVLRYNHEQGITRRLWSIEEVFVPGLLTT